MIVVRDYLMRWGPMIIGPYKGVESPHLLLWKEGEEGKEI
jgi:hypothetical protein